MGLAEITPGISGAEAGNWVAPLLPDHQWPGFHFAGASWPYSYCATVPGNASLPPQFRAPYALSQNQEGQTHHIQSGNRFYGFQKPPVGH